MHGSYYHSLANDDVQAGRASITIPISGRPLHDYVPLYFGIKTPMIACNQGNNEEILFMRFSLDILLSPGVVFSDGNARSAATKFFGFTGIDALAVLDPGAINTVKYAGDPERKRRKQAELLIPNSIPFAKVYDIIVFSENARSKVLALLSKFAKTRAVRVNHIYYFVPHHPQESP